MPRDSAGNYSLPPGNPVVSGTVISSAWANPTMDDIADALTNSLDRNGRGGMLVPFKFLDGTEASPGLSFNSEPATGVYRAGSSDIRITVAGTALVRVTPDPANPGLQEPLEVWDGMAWVKLLTSNSSGAFLKAGDNNSLLNNNAGYLTGNQNISLTGAVTGTGTTSIATVISAGAVGTPEIEDNAVTFAKMANSSVGTNELINSSVTLAKMQNIPTANLLGRASGGTGSVEDLTAAQVRTLINVANGAEANPALVSQAEAQAGTATAERMWSAQRVAQAIAAQASSGGGIKSVQRGSKSVNSPTTQAISPVDMSKSFVTASSVTGIYEIGGVNRTLNAAVYLSAPNQLSFSTYGTMLLPSTVYWEVVEFN